MGEGRSLRLVEFWMHAYHHKFSTFGLTRSQTFWRGFLLPSVASRLPNQLPLAVAASSTTFACLHLNLAAGLPILLLSSACDLLYLRYAQGGEGPSARRNICMPLRWGGNSCNPIQYSPHLHRSGSIGAPLLLHCTWNAYQLLGVALWGKEAFV